MNETQEVVPINGRDLTLKDVVAVAKSNTKVKVETLDRLSKIRNDFEISLEQTFEWDELNPEPKERDTPEYELYLLKRKQKMMYGVTTGFGGHKTITIKGDNAKKLQVNLLRSHACGVGDDFDRNTTRAIMTLRTNTLASGYCGISRRVVEQLEKLLNLDIRPCIPEQGSVGASGDLAPLAHLALALIGEGPVKFGEDGAEECFPNLSKLKEKHPELDIESKLELLAKDGLALINGLAVTTGIGVLAHEDAMNLLAWADVIGAVTLESLLGSTRAFDEIVFTEAVYRHEGARATAGRIRELVDGSKLLNRSSDVHDAYSLRCIPQVHGAVRDALSYVRTTLQNQINSVDDDPIIFSEEEMQAKGHAPLDSKDAPEGTDAAEWMKRRHFEHGNFHGEPIAFAMDMLAIVVAELGNISERRIQMLLDKNHNRELPSCLVRNPHGVNSGYMIAQYTAAALVSENKVLSHPASVDSVPTSANSEDHVSMGTIAARKARRVVENVKNILAIELLCATEALSYRLDLGKDKYWESPDKKDKDGNLKKLPEVRGECGKKTRQLYDKVRGEGGIRLLNDEEDLLDQDKILYTLIKRARTEFLSKPLSEFIGD